MIDGPEAPQLESWDIELAGNPHRAALALPPKGQPVEVLGHDFSAATAMAFLEAKKPAIPWGADAEWCQGVLEWVRVLCSQGQWYPEVKEHKISLRLLLDSVDSRQKLEAFRDCMPDSFRCLKPELSRIDTLGACLDIFAEEIGWSALCSEPVSLDSDVLRELPQPAASLLRTLASGSRSQTVVGNFFDPRQANLFLSSRPSSLGFAVKEPTSDSGQNKRPWSLIPTLCSAQDPHLTFDALEAWKDPRQVPKALWGKVHRFRTFLLQEFGRALPLLPMLGSALASSPPTPIRLDDREFFEFLVKSSGRLQSYGYRLLGPAYLLCAQKPSLHLHLKPPKVDGTTHERLHFRWRVLVAGHALNVNDLACWLKGPNSLFETEEGKRVWLERGRIRRILKELDALPTSGSLLEAFRLAATASVPVQLHFEGELEPLGEPARFRPLPVPDDFCGELRDYQLLGYSWLSYMHGLRLGICLADDMGLGKTVQTLAFLAGLVGREGQGPPALLVCPTSVLQNWMAEGARFTPSLKIKLHHGKRPKNETEFRSEVQDFDLVLTTYQLLQRDLRILTSIEWRTVILDEAQQIKNSHSSFARAARSLPQRGRLLLTGTPIENRLSDLWSLFRFLQPDLLESQRRFSSRFAKPIEERNDPEAREALKSLIGPFILRRSKTDPQIARELPDKVLQDVHCTLTPEQTRLYQRLAQQTVLSAKEQVSGTRRVWVLSRVTKLKQLCDHPALLEAAETADWSIKRSSKLIRLLELLHELPKDEGILIFSQYARMVRKLQRLLAEELGEEVLSLDGRTPREDRVSIVERFQSWKGPRLFCLSLKAGGVGLNLTRASTVVHWDRWWNPAVENQATDRAFRLGQSRSVQVFRFITEGTVEESIAGMLSRKEDLANHLITEGDAWLARLDESELSELLLPDASHDRQRVKP